MHREKGARGRKQIYVGDREKKRINLKIVKQIGLDRWLSGLRAPVAFPKDPGSILST